MRPYRDICLLRLSNRGMSAMLVVSWLLEREYRQHRALDPALPLTYTKWLGTTDRLQQETDEKRERVVKVVIHPGEIATGAYREGREVNERARSDYAVFMWRLETNRRLAGRNNAAIASRRNTALMPASDFSRAG